MNARFTFRGVISRLLLFVVLWWIVSEGLWGEWTLLIASILAATAVSLLMWPPGAAHIGAGPLLRFIPWFFRASLEGGIDVARRAFSRAMPLEPGFVDYPLRLQGEGAQVFFAWLVSLLPGTASVGMNGGVLKVHVLDAQRPNSAALQELEARVAALFGEPVPTDKL